MRICFRQTTNITDDLKINSLDNEGVLVLNNLLQGDNLENLKEMSVLLYLI